MEIEERRNSFTNETCNNNSFSSVSSEKSPKVADKFDPIDIEGQKETGIWVHQPGSEVSQTWEPRKGRNRRLDTEIHRETNDLYGSFNSTVSGSLNNDSSSPDDNPEDKHRMRAVRKGLHKIGSVFRRSSKRDPPTPTPTQSVGETVLSPHANIKAINAKEIGVKFIKEDNAAGFPTGKVQKEGMSTEGSSPESPSKGNVKDMAKNILKHAEKSARGLKHVLSHKTRKTEGDTLGVPEREILENSDSSDDDSLSVQLPRDERIPVASKVIVSFDNDSFNSSNNVVVQTASSDTTLSDEGPMKKVSVEDPANIGSPEKSSKESVEQKHDKDEMVGQK